MTLQLKITGRVISKKNSKRIMRSSSGKPFIASSLAFEKFQHDARYQLMNQTYGMCFKKPVRATYTFFLKGKIDSDIDNMISSINDILMYSHIVEDDKLIVEIVANKIAGCREFETEISIQGEA